MLITKGKYLINETVYFHPAEQLLQHITKDAKDRPLNTPASRCLLLLLKNQGRVIAKEEFFQQVWESKGQYSNTNTLYQNISLIRKALKSMGVSKDVIQTVPREGIRFSGTAILYEDEDFTIPNNMLDNTGNNLTSSTALEITAPENKKVKIYWIAISAIMDFCGVLYRNKTKSILAAVLIALLIYFHLRNGFPRNYSFFDNYINIGEVNQCVILINGNLILRDKNEYLSFIKEHDIHCKPQQKVYMAIDTQGVKIFVHTCEKIQNNKLMCHSNFFIE